MYSLTSALKHENISITLMWRKVEVNQLMEEYLYLEEYFYLYGYVVQQCLGPVSVQYRVYSLPSA